MTAERWRQIGDLYDKALDCPPDERAALLDDACRNDAALRQEVEKMLAADAQHGALEAPAWMSLPELVAASADESPRGALPAGGRIGPYDIVRRIGQGGMGEVFLATRAVGAAQQTVALKLLRPGLENDRLLRRFAAEQEILAQLDHPRIARMLDAGQAGDGRPYLVMEYVDGEPITDYCDRHRLSVDARLRLFEQVCDAVQSAHQSLVVHRDLKPSNVLVADAATRDAAGGQVKLLDFGIAKVLDPMAEGGALQTQTGRLLTPAYASPEQLAGGAIATTSDVYSLGVLLYEILAGRRPTTGTTPTEVARRLADPAFVERPSDAVTTGETTGETATARRTSTDRLQRRLRGDLDTIILKALRTDPARRYGSAAALADDIRRHLDGLPVQARPDTLGYRVGKFVRRQWVGVAAAAAFVALLAVFAGSMAWQQAQTAAERDRAEQERGRAERALAQSETVAAFMTDLFQASDPGHSRGDTLTSFDLLRLGTDRLAALDGEPEVASRLRVLLGRTYRHLGDLESAAPLLEDALTDRRSRLGMHEDVAASLTTLVNLRMEQSRYAEADSFAREALRIRHALRGPQHPSLAQNLGQLARVRGHLGDYEGAAERFRELIALLRATDAGDEDLSVALHNYGALLSRQTDYERALVAFQESLALSMKVGGADYTGTLSAQSRVGGALSRVGRHDEALALLRETVAGRLRVLGPDHPGLATSLTELGLALAAAGRAEEAIEAYAEAERIYRPARGDRSAHVAAVRYNAARALHDLGRTVEAEAAYREALSIRHEVYGPGHARTAAVEMRLGRLLQEHGDIAEAETLLTAALPTLRERMGPDHEWTLDAERWLAEVRAARAGA